MKNCRSLSDEQIYEIQEMRKNGMKVIDIVASTGYGHTMVKKYTKKYAPEYRKFSEDEIKEISMLRKSGKQFTEIAKIFHSHPGSIRYYLTNKNKPESLILNYDIHGLPFVY